MLYGLMDNLILYICLSDVLTSTPEKTKLVSVYTTTTQVLSKIVLQDMVLKSTSFMIVVFGWRSNNSAPF